MVIPDVLHADARIASRWAKQNMKEQLVMLEVLFSVWGYVLPVRRTFGCSNI
jgi:nuclear pore complex protein Nup188